MAYEYVLTEINCSLQRAAISSFTHVPYCSFLKRRIRTILVTHVQRPSIGGTSLGKFRAPSSSFLASNARRSGEITIPHKSYPQNQLCRPNSPREGMPQAYCSSHTEGHLHEYHIISFHASQRNPHSTYTLRRYAVKMSISGISDSQSILPDPLPILCVCIWDAYLTGSNLITGTNGRDIQRYRTHRQILEAIPFDSERSNAISSQAP